MVASLGTRAYVERVLWLGIDIGTTSSRALLVDEKGRSVAGATAPHEDVRMERPLWAEQQPENWWEAAQDATRRVLAEARTTGEEISGIGLSGQMHGLVTLDQNHQVIRPALIWCDQRSQEQVDWINCKVGRENVLTYTANPVLTGFTLPKLLWVRDHEPANFERIRKILLPKDYVRLRLTGEYATDVSDASGTALFDVAHRRWSAAMAERLELDSRILPGVYESSEVTGTVTEQAAAVTGLKAGTPVVAGGGDQASGAVGTGVVEPGIISCTLGTSGVVFAHLEHPLYDPLGRVHTFCHAVKNQWHVMGVTQGAGLSLQWFRNRLAPGASYEELTAEAATSPAGAQGLFWLPYLMGERTPHLDAAARGGWVGLTAKHTRADLIRALLEGVSYSQKDSLDVIEQLGAHAETVRVSGGGGRSGFWRQLLADVLGKRVAVLESQEGSAYGAALLAMVGTGSCSSVRELCRTVIHEVESVLPRPREAGYYRGGHEIYRSLYPALRPIYGQIQNLD